MHNTRKYTVTHFRNPPVNKAWAGEQQQQQQHQMQTDPLAEAVVVVIYTDVLSLQSDQAA